MKEIRNLQDYIDSEKPKKRYQHKLLKPILSTKFIKERLRETPAQKKKRRKKTKMWIVLGAVTAAMVIGGAIIVSLIRKNRLKQLTNT